MGSNTEHGFGMHSKVLGVKFPKLHSSIFTVGEKPTAHRVLQLPPDMIDGPSAHAGAIASATLPGATHGLGAHAKLAGESTPR
jgi:hypothetical protein